MSPSNLAGAARRPGPWVVFALLSITLALCASSAQAQALKSVGVAPTSVVGSAPSTGTVTLTAAAPTGGITVALSSSNPGDAAVGASVLVPSGSKTGTFAILTMAVQTTTAVVIQADYNAKIAKATLTVKAPSVKSLVVKPASVVGGRSSVGTITLNGPAPTGGTAVVVASNSSAASAASPVSVPAGSLTATFPITTNPVSSATPAAISASAGGATRKATLTVKAPSVSSIVLSRKTVLGGAALQATISLTGPAPSAGLNISISSSDTNAVSPPPTIAIPAGSSSAATPLSTNPVAVGVTVTLTASIGASGKSAKLAVKAPSLVSIKVTPSSKAGGTGPVTGAITINGPAPAGGLPLGVSSDTPSAASVSSPVVVAAGKKVQTFSIQTYAVTSAVPVSISATLNGAVKSASLTVEPRTLPASFGKGHIRPGAPQGIAIDPNSGNIYVCSWGSNGGAMVEFDQYGYFIKTFGGTGKHALKSPVEAAVDRNGNIYVGDYNNHDCVEFDANGKYVQTFTGASSGITLGVVTGVAVDSSGNVYVADDSNSRIVVFTPSGAVSSQFSTIIGAYGGTLAGTVGIVLDSAQQNIWVAQYYYHGFAEYTLGGALEAFYGNTAKSGTPEPGFFYEPYSIAIDSSDHVYVTDVYVDDIQEFDSSGNFIALQGQYGTGPGQFVGANGVAVDRSGDVLVSDGGSNSITVFKPPF